MNQITLRDFFMHLNGPFTFLNTNNESFPKEFRRDRYHHAELYVALIKKDKDHELFNRFIDTIEMTYHVNEDDLEIDASGTYYDINHGFVAPYDGAFIPLAPVIKVTLQTSCQNYMGSCTDTLNL